MSRLLLVRHGPSAHRATPALLDRGGAERWRAAGDVAGLRDDAAPPAALVQVAREARIVASSDLPRARDSARRLGGDARRVATLGLFREVALPMPAVPLRAPYIAWDAMTHARWLLDIARGRDASPADLSRARAAAAWCREACATALGGDVLVVTHGVFRRLLARQLVAEGWRATRGARSYAHWSAWHLEP